MFLSKFTGTVPTGVPQGYILGQASFIVCINDFSSDLSKFYVSTVMYVDYLAVKISVSTINLVNQLISHVNSVTDDSSASHVRCLNKE